MERTHREKFNIGDEVKWEAGKGSNRSLSGFVVAVIPADTMPSWALRKTPYKISRSVIANRVRSHERYAVDIGELDRWPADRIRIPTVSKLVLVRTGRASQ